MRESGDEARKILLALGACASALLFAVSQASVASPQSGEVHAYRLYTGPDGNSHVEEGSVPQGTPLPAATVSFEITPAHSPPVWHNDPQPQYVVSMTGMLRFSTRSGEGFLLRPGEVLIAEDNTGTGHGWQMQGDAPWTRTYVVLPRGVRSGFTPKPK